MKAYTSILVAMALTASSAIAQTIPSLNDIVTNVKRSTLPPRGYDVEIAQTIEAQAGTSMRVSIDAGTMLKQNTFRALYTPTEGLHLDTADLARRSAVEKVPQPLSNPEPSDLKVTVDLRKVFESADAWQNVKITRDMLNGRECYVVAGKDDVLGFTIWIDVANSYASRLVVELQGRAFSATDIQYRRVDGQYWLPSEIKIHHALDGSAVSQRLANYRIQ